MAIKFGQDRAVDFASGNLMTFAKSFSAMNGQPLDNREVWYDKTLLEEEVKGTKFYVGQKVCYVDIENQKVYQYSVQLDGTLKEIGVAPVSDGATIAVDVDTGKISLYGVEGLDIHKTYVPSIVNGVLTWDEPDTSTAEGQTQEINSLKTRTQALETIVNGVEESEGVEAQEGLVHKVASHTEQLTTNTDAIKSLETKVGRDADGETPASGLFKEINDVVTRVNTIEDDYLKSTDKTEITNQFDSISTDISNLDAAYKAADKLLEDRISALEGTTHFSGAGLFADRPLEGDDGDIYVATDTGKEYIWANGQWIELGDVTAEQERLTNLETQVTEIITDLEDKAPLSHTHEINDVNELQSTLNTIDSRISTTETDLTSLISKVGNPTGETEATGLYADIANLVSEVDTKVDITTATQNSGIRFINQNEIDKLKALVIDNETGGVAISGTVNADNVQGLAEAIVDVVTGTGVVNDAAETVLNKLSIQAGAQVNLIETIKLNGAALTVTDKSVDITLNALGITSSEKENEIKINSSKTMQVNSLNVNRLVQTEGEELILNGGNSEVTSSDH